jgi:hypothetical protein
VPHPSIYPQKAETRMGEEFGTKMRNITKEILTDVLTGPKEWIENVNEVRSCLTHTCKNGGTCHQTADVCLCAGGYTGECHGQADYVKKLN